MRPRAPTMQQMSNYALAISWLLFLGGPLLAHFNLIDPSAGLLAFGIAAMTAILGLASHLFLLLQNRRLQRPIRLILWLPPILALGAFVSQAWRYPSINDVSTDLDNPPRFVVAANVNANRGKDLSYPEEFQSIVLDAYPDLLALQSPLPPRATFDLVRKQASRQRNWHITRIDVTALSIEGFAISYLFRFKDDFVIRVQAQDQGSQIDMRSRSRVGQSDLGANAERIKDFFTNLAVLLPQKTQVEEK